MLNRKLLILILFITGCQNDSNLIINRYTVEQIPLLTSVGSALESFPHKKSDRENYYFYTVSDAGNQPAILKLKVRKDIAQVEKFIPIKTDIAIDLEGIALENSDKVWLASEEGPALIEFHLKSESIGRILTPSKGLPEVFKHIQPGRGFEGIAIYGDTLIASVQSVLDIDGQTKESANFIRLLNYNLKTDKTEMYAYPIDRGVEANLRDPSITDLAIVSKGKILVLEKEGDHKNNDLKIRIFIVDISRASDISNKKIDNLELEYEDDIQKLYGNPLSGRGGAIKKLEKELILDLTEIGWRFEQAEGIAILNDFQTIAVSNSSSKGKPALWLIKLPEPIVIDWTKRAFYTVGLIVVLAILIWAMLPQRRAIKIPTVDSEPPF